MTKHDFLNLLEQRLKMLNDSERTDLLSEYEQHIEMKMEAGLSEEEAIADFGDPEELIKELLEAYHLNPTYQQKNRLSSQLMFGAKSCANFLSCTFDSLCRMGKGALFRLILQFIGLCIFLAALFTAGALFLSLCRSFVVYTLPFGRSIGMAVCSVVELCLVLLFFSFSIYLLIFFVRRYILIDYQPLQPPVYYNQDTVSPLVDGAKNYAANAKAQASEAIARMRQRNGQSNQQAFLGNDGRPLHLPHIPFPDISLGALCMKVLVFCCRVIGFLMLLGAACTALGLIAGAATGLVFVLMGYSVIGPFLIILGCGLLSIVVTGLLIQFVFGIGGAKA